jgi:cytidylate kinase
MKDRIIITIGRQFGSGGREVGQKIAQALGISYYDKELMTLAAKESGLSEDFFQGADEHTSSILSYAFPVGYNLMGMVSSFYNTDFLSNDKLFQYQSDAIRHVAEKESCVIVGRCADYILRDDKCCLSFFIHNNYEERIRRVMEMLGTDRSGAKAKMHKVDKSRAEYYNYYTNKEWGVASSYNYSLDMSVLGVDQSVEMMLSLIEKFRNM